jgi:hypothetical protein
MPLILLTCPSTEPELKEISGCHVGPGIAAKFLLEDDGAGVHPEGMTQWLSYVLVAARWALVATVVPGAGDAYSAGDRTPPVGMTHIFGTIALGVRPMSERA